MAKYFKDTPWPVLLLVVSFLCPTEFSVYVGSARLPPHRALLLILLPYALMQTINGKGGTIKPFDVAFTLFAIWTFVIYIVHHGMANGIQTGGSMALDAYGSYLIARVFVRDLKTFRATAGVLLIAVGLAGLIALPETIFGKIFVHDFLAKVTGYHHPTGAETRLGLTRAYGTFDHPIHLGTFCAAAFAMSVYAARKRNESWLRLLVIPASAMLSLSSAPLLSLLAQGGLMVIEKLTRGIKGRTYLGFAVISLGFVAVSLVATRSPFAIIATGFTLNSWTGYYRLMIWEFGLANVAANPWFGLGLHDWARPSWMISPTVDAFWLVIAMRGGIPSITLLLAGVVLVGWGVALKVKHANAELRCVANGWLLSLAALSLVGCTVHFWNVPYAYFFFFLGLGGWLADPRVLAVGRVRTSAAELREKRVAWVAPAPGLAVPAGAGGPSWSGARPSWPVPVVRSPRERPRRRPKSGRRYPARFDEAKTAQG